MITSKRYKKLYPVLLPLAVFGLLFLYNIGVAHGAAVGGACGNDNDCQSGLACGADRKCAFTIVPTECKALGNYPLESFFVLAEGLIQIILGVSGSLALLMFVYGGFLWVLSAGEDKRITAGKETVKNAVIGLIIIFGSWTIVNFVIGSLGTGESPLAGTIIDGGTIGDSGVHQRPDGSTYTIVGANVGSQASLFGKGYAWSTPWSVWSRIQCLTIGDPCLLCRDGTPGARTQYCKEGDTSLGSKSRCVDRGGTGDACTNDGECAEGLVCDTTGKCSASRTLPTDSAGPPAPPAAPVAPGLPAAA